MNATPTVARPSSPATTPAVASPTPVAVNTATPVTPAAKGVPIKVNFAEDEPLVELKIVRPVKS